MAKSRIHLIAPAGSCRPFLDAIGAASAAELIAMVQSAVGTAFDVVGDHRLIEAEEDEHRGGRSDDRERADDLQHALADDANAAVVLLRGGAWFTRILPLIDFRPLDRRTSPIAVFGFSELTTLVNIVASTKQGLGVYDMGPAFLTYGLKRFAATRDNLGAPDAARPSVWMADHLRAEFDAFFHDVVRMIQGQGTKREITAELVRGALPRRGEIVVVGGNLTVLSTMIGSRYDACIRPRGRWLVLEDFNDQLDRFDRLLAHLTLADYWSDTAGVLLGDFHRGYDDLGPALLELLDRHLPTGCRPPILRTAQVGHVWPMAPLPLNRPLTFDRLDHDRYTIHWPASALQTV